MIMNTWNEEEVNGVVIGTYYLAGRVFLNGKQQGGTIYDETEEGLREKANTYVSELKAEWGALFSEVFKGKWELRIAN